MKTIELDDDLYFFIASQTRHIGESASDILRRLLEQPVKAGTTVPTAPVVQPQPLADAMGLEALLDSDELQKEEKSINRFMLVLPKMALLMAAVVLALKFLPINAAAFAAGYSVFIVSIVVESVLAAMRPPTDPPPQ